MSQSREAHRFLSLTKQDSISNDDQEEQRIHSSKFWCSCRRYCVKWMAIQFGCALSQDFEQRKGSRVNGTTPEPMSKLAELLGCNPCRPQKHYCKRPTSRREIQDAMLHLWPIATDQSPDCVHAFLPWVDHEYDSDANNR